jgi:RNA-directed DNA polymerase
VVPSQITPASIAAAMELSEDGLWNLARRIEVVYRERRMQLIGKKHRPIDPMHKAPKKLFRKLHRFIQKHRLAHPRAHGGVCKRSCFTSAREHLGHRYVWTRDVHDCYPSITPTAFQDEMRSLGFPLDTAELLSLLCTVRGAIPQGSPLSNDALNLYLWRVDQALASFCGQQRLAYSRVADDIVISGNNREAGVAAITFVERLLREHGLRINVKKRGQSGFQRKEQKPRVHSINVHKKNGTEICDAHHTQVIAIAEKYRAACKSVQLASLVALAHKRQTLVGWLNYCHQADHSPARHIRRMLEAGDRAVLKKLRDLKINSRNNKWWFMSKRRNEPKRIVGIWSKRWDSADRDVPRIEVAKS